MFAIFADTLLTFMISGALISLLTSMISVYISNKGAEHPVPRIIRLLFLTKLARILCVTSQDHVTAPSTNQVATEPEVISITRPNSKEKLRKEMERSENGVLTELQKITSYMEKKEEEEAVTEEWKLLAKVIDRLLFWLFTLAFVIFIIVYAVRVADNQQKGEDDQTTKPPEDFY